MSKHTNGPWHVGQGNGEGCVFSESGRMRMLLGGMTLFPICKVQTGWDEGEDEANARLIASAPELLEAAQKLLSNLIETEEYGPDDIDPDDWDGPLDENGAAWYWDAWNLRAAITKATGGEA
jgi:hypothetical protein